LPKAARLDGSHADPRPGLREAVLPLADGEQLRGAFEQSAVDSPASNGTFFSTLEFASAWSRSFPESDEPFPIAVTGSGPPRTIYLIQTSARFGKRSLSSGSSDDLCVSPGWRGELEYSTVAGMLNDLKRPPTKRFVWRVRFDHEVLAEHLISAGIPVRGQNVHVVDLDGSYEAVRSRYSKSRRNMINRAYKSGLIVRTVCSFRDLWQHYQIYRELGLQKGWSSIYPLELLVELVKLRELTRFYIAEFNGQVAGGMLFVRDGSSVIGFQGSVDRKYSHIDLSSALVDAGIRWAVQIGARSFNLGTSGSNASLAQFKSLWGSRRAAEWVFEWSNPFLQRLATSKRMAFGALRKATATVNPDAPAQRNSQTRRTPTEWADRASLGELGAVLTFAGGPERDNLLMHGVSIMAAKVALKQGYGGSGSNGIVLDYGCGNGRMLRVFREKVGFLVGTDVHHEMLLAAQRHGVPQNACLLRTNGYEIPLADNSVDMIYVSSVLKYALFPPGWRCLLGSTPTLRKNAATMDEMPSCGKAYNPEHQHVVREMYRVLRPSGAVVQYEMYVNFQPSIFTGAFLEAGFKNEQIRILRRYRGELERALECLPPSGVSRAGTILAGEWCARLRSWFDDPSRIGGGFKDYLFVWRKPGPDRR
jgi:ubiquinone/menaquinone biosynthesis C-methylase UbiE